VHGRNASQISELTHESSRSWQAATDGDYLDIYLDVLGDEEYEKMRASVNNAKAVVDDLFHPETVGPTSKGARGGRRRGG
jgi:hypothetical protein